MCASVLLACVYTYHLHALCPWRPEEVTVPLELDGSELPGGYWEPNTGLLQEQQVLLTTGSPSLQASSCTCSTGKWALYFSICQLWNPLTELPANKNIHYDILLDNHKKRLNIYFVLLLQSIYHVSVAILLMGSDVSSTFLWLRKLTVAALQCACL